MISEQITIFFDGACHLCSREIELYKNRDKDTQLRFVDISQANFNAELEGLDKDSVQKKFHVKTKNGKILTGVPAFQKIWDELGILQPLSKFYDLPLGQSIMDTGYNMFAKVRPFLPKKENCDNGQCKI